MRFSARISLTCFLVSFFIGFSFRPRRFSGGNYSDNFLSVFPAIGMNHQHDHSASNQSERLPSFLAFYNAILSDEHMRIFEDQAGGLEADFVFRKVPAALELVPFEAHVVQLPSCNYIIVRAICWLRAAYAKGPVFITITTASWSSADLTI